jgi:signal peptidase I
MYIVIEKLFSKNDYTVMIKDRRKEIFANTIMIVIATLFVMLVSCQFRFGLLVVGSESMTGTLDKGDALIFEKYTTQEIVEGQVIIFNYENIQTIHRVIDIQKVNGEYRYFTQGDANSKPDEGYRVKDDISSLVKLRIKYIGYPTLFVRSIFEK